MRKAHLALATSLFFAAGFGPLLTACGSHEAPPPKAAPVLARPAPPPPRVALRSTEVDAMLRAAWDKEKVTPAPTVDDAGFLRRVFLDLAGTVPPPEKVVAFLADTSTDKRARVIDELLASPRYADHFTNYWDRVLLGRDARPGVVDRIAFRAWLHDELAKNVPYDKMVYALVTAKGVNSPGGNPLDELTMPASMTPGASAAKSGEGTSAPSAGPAPAPGDPPVNGAVNWYLRYADALPDLAGTTSRVFLGVQIQCAQCHDHKTEKWKTTQFQSFEACFLRTRAQQVDKGKVKGVRRVEVKDVPHAVKLPKRMDMPEAENAAPRALDGTDFTKEENRREALAAWMIKKDNPWFAKEIVNRMWAQLLGRGFAEPIDDFRESNPPVAPEILDRLAKELVESGYDVKGLLRIIANTEAYQRAAAAGQEGSTDEKLWAHFQVERLGPDELLDSLVQATKFDTLLEKSAGENIERVRFGMRRQFAFLFDVDEESDHHDEFDGTITQALFLMNGPLVNRAAGTVPGLALTETLAMQGGEDAKIRALYLRSLSRPPTDEETARWIAFLDAPRDVVVTPPPPAPAANGAEKPGAVDPKKPDAQGDKKQGGKQGRGAGVLRRIEARMEARDARAPAPAPGPFAAKRQAYEDLFWTLLNSSEFLFNH